MTSPDESGLQAPPETPGPSVTPPQQPGSETDRRECADATRPDPELTGAHDPDEEIVIEEESAAAAEGAAVGGVATRDARDPAMQPVYEAGGGEQEGFEAAEGELIETATATTTRTRSATPTRPRSNRTAPPRATLTATACPPRRCARTRARARRPMAGDPNLSADRGPDEFEWPRPQ